MGDVPRARDLGEVSSSVEHAPRTVLVVDDHRTFADLMCVALSSQPDLSCVGTAYDVSSGIDLVRRHRPDVVVIDYQFDGDERDGVEATATITSTHPETAVVILTGHADHQLMRRAADAGASSLMPKDGSLQDLLSTLRTAGRAGLVVHPRLLRSLLTVPRPAASPETPLSRRERDVLAMLTIGLDARAIAGQLGISLSTCRGYVKTLLRKLDAHSQLEAVAIARRRGLLDAEDAR